MAENDIPAGRGGTGGKQILLQNRQRSEPPWPDRRLTGTEQDPLRCGSWRVRFPASGFRCSPRWRERRPGPVAGAGKSTPKIDERLQFIEYPRPCLRGRRAVFWDVFGRKGAVRTTASEMGPTC